MHYQNRAFPGRLNERRARGLEIAQFRLSTFRELRKRRRDGQRMIEDGRSFGER